MARRQPSILSSIRTPVMRPQPSPPSPVAVPLVKEGSGGSTSRHGPGPSWVLACFDPWRPGSASSAASFRR
eukprot:9307758-Prorocentrum_lima.AAC.1